MKKLIVITYPDFFPGEGKIITRLFEEGLQYLHLRKPGCPEEKIIQLIDAICPEFHNRIILHDCFNVADNYPIGGLHINRRNNHIPANFKGSLSRSCHSLQEIKESKGFDYVFLSPIFDSISKEGYQSNFPIEVLKEASEKGVINEKVIALGGLDSTTIPLLKEIKFGGFAILGALWGNQPTEGESDPIIKRYKQFQI